MNEIAITIKKAKLTKNPFSKVLRVTSKVKGDKIQDFESPDKEKLAFKKLSSICGMKTQSNKSRRKLHF